MWRSLSVLAVVAVATLSCGGTSERVKGPEGPSVAKRSTRSSGDAMVRVQVYDNTERKPLADKAEIWFRGHGSWWLKPDTRYGAAVKNLGRRELGKKDTIALYPDGRGGQEIMIPFTMTSEMNPNGSARDSIIITISDNEVEVVGLPVKAATGDAEMKVKRGG